MHFSLFLGSLSKKKKKKAELQSTVLKCYFSGCLLQCSSSISRGGTRRTENSITLPGEELPSGQGLESPSPLCVWGLRKGTATAKGCLCIPKDCFCPGSVVCGSHTHPAVQAVQLIIEKCFGTQRAGQTPCALARACVGAGICETLRLLWEALEQETLLSYCGSALGFVRETERRSRDCILSISREKLRCFFFAGAGGGGQDL